MPQQRPRPGAAAALAAGTLVLTLLLSGCGAGAQPRPTPSPGPTTSVTEPPATVASDGVLLRDLGYTHGPLDAFSLPRTAVLSASVDQADNVAAVLSAPPAPEVAAYLRRTLPAAGFTITADDPAQDTLTFTGRGWAGSVTAGAVLLRPTR